MSHLHASERQMRRRRRMGASDKVVRHDKGGVGWEADYARKLASDGYRGDRAVPMNFCYLVTDVRVVLRGDEFTFAGTEVELKSTLMNMRECMISRYAGQGSARSQG